jgi:rubredoxin
MKYECICGYVYDEAEGDSENGVPAGTKWADVPDDYVCPTCNLGKDEFTAV